MENQKEELKFNINEIKRSFANYMNGFKPDNYAPPLSIIIKFIVYIISTISIISFTIAMLLFLVLASASIPFYMIYILIKKLCRVK